MKLETLLTTQLKDLQTTQIKLYAQISKEEVYNL